MKIIYTQNPLACEFHLDEHEQKLFRAKVQLEDYSDSLSEVTFILEQDPIDIARLKSICTWEGLFGEERDEELDRRAKIFEQEFLSEHCGDCTCVPASCSKCYALELIDGFKLDPTWKIGKHTGYILSHLFRKEEIDTCDKAIAHLKKDQSFLNPDEKLAKVIDFLTTYRDTYLVK